ncbi:unnamed protein product [Protopolystoma xenopodis]|uniref:Uncharacterized protein n=1 Tax=Protopolystoma xenopodis TaxID=117903 RepID=A0A448WGT4_9PLAT|nr:unnamed protein product [Protopolystoma xenopodis]
MWFHSQTLRFEFEASLFPTHTSSGLSPFAESPLCGFTPGPFGSSSRLLFFPNHTSSGLYHLPKALCGFTRRPFGLSSRLLLFPTHTSSGRVRLSKLLAGPRLKTQSE